jgi:putative hemolysin
LEDPLAGPGSTAWVPAWFYALAVIFTGIASILFAYCYFLLLNFSRSKLLQLADENGNKNGKERIEGYLARYNQIFNAVVALEITFKILFILCLYILVTQTFEMDMTEALLPTFVLAGIWFVFLCRILPAEMGSLREEQVLLHVLPFLNSLSITFYPVLFPIILFRRMVHKWIKPSTPAEEAEQFAEEIIDVVEEGEREGVIHEQEADMIESIVKLHSCEVSEIMTPRMDMVCVDASAPITEMLKTAIDLGHSRIPVYKENRDTIVGVLYVKDLLNYWPEGEKNLPELNDLLRKPYFIPETKCVSELFSEFRENKVHIAIVLDEYGGTAGLVTNEDVLEEIVGEIVDEYDKEEEVELKILRAGKAEASAKLHIDELNEKMETHLPESDDYDTIGGFIFSKLGKVPSKGDTVLHDNVALKVIDVDDRRINKISIEITEDEEGE